MKALDADASGISDAGVEVLKARISGDLEGKRNLLSAFLSHVHRQKGSHIAANKKRFRDGRALLQIDTGAFELETALVSIWRCTQFFGAGQRFGKDGRAAVYRANLQKLS